MYLPCDMILHIQIDYFRITGTKKALDLNRSSALRNFQFVKFNIYDLPYLRGLLIFACAAARRAMGTR